MIKNNIKTDAEKIASGFESQNSEAPEYIWENLSQKLIIENSWEKINLRLEKNELKKVRTEELRMILIGFFILIIFVFIPLIPDKQANSTISELHLANSSNVQYSKTDQFVMAQYQENRKTTSKKSSTGILYDKKKLPVHLIQNNIDKKRTDSKIQKSELIEGALSLQKMDTNLVSMKSKNVVSITLQRLYESAVPSTGYNKDEREQRQKQKKYEIGIGGAYNNTIIINNVYRNSLEHGSLYSVKPSFKPSYSFLFTYHINANRRICMKYETGKEIQRSHNFKNGLYNQNILEFSYLRMSLLYSRKLNFNMKKFQSHLIVEGGADFAYAYKSKIYVINDHNLSEYQQDVITPYGLGLQFTVGQEYLQKSYTLGFGLEGHYGLNNILKNNDQVQAKFNKTRSASLGLFIQLKKYL